MDIQTLRDVVSIMRENDLAHLRMEDGQGGVIELDRSAAPAPAAPPVIIAPSGGWAEPAQPVSPQAAPRDPEPAPAPLDLVPAQSGLTEVEAPMVGVFYAAPAPGAEPFVRVGSKVRKGDTLCIVEAMKCMNEITAEQDGEVVDICVSDGELVEYGRCLMRLS